MRRSGKRARLFFTASMLTIFCVSAGGAAGAAVHHHAASTIQITQKKKPSPTTTTKKRTATRTTTTTAVGAATYTGTYDIHEAGPDGSVTCETLTTSAGRILLSIGGGTTGPDYRWLGDQSTLDALPSSEILTNPQTLKTGDSAIVMGTPQTPSQSQSVCQPFVRSLFVKLTDLKKA